MSNVNVNNTGANCANDGKGNVCGAEKLRVKPQSRNNSAEIASDFDVHSDTDQTTFSTEKVGTSFRPNEGPVSERTAWN